MITTMTEVIQVSFGLVQVVLRASARTWRKNSTGLVRGFGGDASTEVWAPPARAGGLPLGPRPMFRPARPLKGALGAWSLAIDVRRTRYDPEGRGRREQCGEAAPSGEAPHGRWQEWRDSNPRPSVLETDALPAELHSYGQKSARRRAEQPAGARGLRRSRAMYQRGPSQASGANVSGERCSAQLTVSTEPSSAIRRRSTFSRG